MKNFLESQNFFRLLTAVQADDAKNSEFQGDWTKEKLSNSLIFGEIGVWHRKLRKGKLNRYKYDVSLV